MSRKTWASLGSAANNLLLTALVAALAACSGGDQTQDAASSTQSSQAPFNYPDTQRMEQVDTYHGTVVADPYRWLEQDVRESQAVADWVAAQNTVTNQYLNSLPKRDQIKEQLTRLWDFEKFSLPVKRGGRYFLRINSGLQNQSPIYVADSLDAEPALVIDPNGWSADGTVALSDWTVSPNGNYIAYGVQDGGSDWRDGYIWDVAAGKALDDKIIGLKYWFGAEWRKDESGFYYSRFPVNEAEQDFQSLNLYRTVYFHKVGTDPSEDQVIYERPDDPELGFEPNLTDDDRYLFLLGRKGTDARYQVVYIDLQAKNPQPVTLIQEFEADWQIIHNQGSKIWFATNKDAPLGRLVVIDLENPAKENWVERIAESNLNLSGISVVGERIIAQYLKDARSVVKLFDLQGNPQGEVELPGIGSATGFDGKTDDPETFYSFASYNRPDTIYRYHISGGESTVWKAPKLPFNPDNYDVKQVFYRSKDGTEVPMIITHKKGVELNGKNPTLLYGYGGFNVSLTPRFSAGNMGWLEMGGVYAVANMRGGGEYGEKWHKAGTKLQKQNVFDDFIAAAEYLIDQQYTSPKHLAIHGASNGGLLIGATVNQRPELFAAAVPAVGVMDMLRFQKFTAGRYWTDDYGSSDNPQEFKALYAYSPYHNVKSDIDYPPILVLTADTDDRVIPGHSFKYIAALQHEYQGDNPVLIRIETRAGHGAGKPTAMQIEEATDKLAFIAKHTGLN